MLAGNIAPLFAGGVLAAMVLAAVVRWARFSWHLDERALVIDQGLVSRQRRVIPLERIQSVDLVRRLRHRAFGVVEVRVEAVGGSQTEGRLDALSEAEAEQLRRALLAARDGRPFDAPASGPEAEPTGEQLVRLRPRQLVVAGLTGGRVGIAAALLGIAEQLFGDRIQELSERFQALPNLFSPTGLIGLAVGVLFLAFLVSVAVTVTVYWDFRLERDGDELRIRRGLLEQRFDTLPLRRVQALRIEENLVRRVFGLAAVKVDVAGKSGGEDNRDTSFLLPIGTRAQARSLVATLLGTPEPPGAHLERMPAAALRRRLVRALAVTAVPVGAAVYVAGTTGLVAGLIAVPALLVAVDAYRNLGWAQEGGVVVGRYGVAVRRTFYVRARNLQSLALTATPPQRAAGLSTLQLQIPRSPGIWRGPALLDLDRADADRLLGRLAGTLTAAEAAPRDEVRAQ